MSFINTNVQYTGIGLDLSCKVQNNFFSPQFHRRNWIFYGILVYTKSCKLVGVHVNFNISSLLEIMVDKKTWYYINNMYIREYQIVKLQSHILLVHLNHLYLIVFTTNWFIDFQAIWNMLSVYSDKIFKYAWAIILYL